jgi:Coenzyme F420-reducing hydrogenase, beta subunit
MIELYNKKENCCGCTACLNICPKSAIVMKTDQKGFLYPFILKEKCIECGMCKKVCSFQNGYDTSSNFEMPYVYAIKHKDEIVRMNSTSGGAFTAISDFVLKQGGVVFGAAFDNNMNVIHQTAKNSAERDKFKGSKYVQSDLNNIFHEVKELLLDNKYVLFTGTPCQVSGLNSYLGGIRTDRLILCDIVCHGTPSPLLWKEYVSKISMKYNKKIISYLFRDKRIGWHGANVTAVFDDFKKITNDIFIKAYSNLYFADFITRECCQNCKYTNLHRPSDITIADFWGIEKSMPDFDDNKGISLVLVNTPKGQNLFETIRQDLEVRESNPSDCLQPQLQYPNKPSPRRDAFWKDYFAHGYEYIIKKYAQYTLMNRTKQRIKTILIKTKLIGIIKRILGKGR